MTELNHIRNRLKNKLKAVWNVRIMSWISVGIILMGLVCYQIRLDADTLEVSFYYLKSDEVTNGMRIVQLSDLHLKEFGEKNQELVEKVAALKPDLIAITGDMNMSYNDDYHVVLELCRQLVGITEVYYVMGNHEFVDFAHRKTKIGDDIETTGVHLLENQSEKITVKGNEVEIGGLVSEPENYEKRGGKAFVERFLQGSEFKLLLVHYPEYFLGTLEKMPIDLALCGHAHGGIIRIPYIGGLYASEQGFFPKMTEGMHNFGEAAVIVSRGLGNSGWVPRINNRPELVVIDVNWY